MKPSPRFQFIFLVFLLLLSACRPGSFTNSGPDSISGSGNTARQTSHTAVIALDGSTVHIGTYHGDIQAVPYSGERVEVEVRKTTSGVDQEAARADLENMEVNITQENKLILVNAERTTDRSDDDSRIDLIARIPSSASVNLITTQGKLAFNGALTPGGHSFIVEVDGDIEITLPADAAFHLEADANGGKISCDFSITREGLEAEDKLTGTVGTNPQVNILAVTGSGNITIRK